MEKLSLIGTLRRAVLFAVVAAIAACGVGIPGPLAQAPSLKEEASLSALRQTAQTKAVAAKAAAARLTPAQRDEALQIFATAFSLAEQQDYETAKVAFQRGLAIDPSNGQAEYFLAEILMQLNDVAGAMPHYALAQALSPNTTEGFKAEVALGKAQADLLSSLQAGQVWNLSFTSSTGIFYAGTVNVTERLDGTHFKASIELSYSNANGQQAAHEDATISISGDAMTINCSNAYKTQGGGKYVADNFQLTKSGANHWAGTNQDTAGHADTGVVLQRS